MDPGVLVVRTPRVRACHLDDVIDVARGYAMDVGLHHHERRGAQVDVPCLRVQRPPVPVVFALADPLLGALAWSDTADTASVRRLGLRPTPVGRSGRFADQVHADDSAEPRSSDATDCGRAIGGLPSKCLCPFTSKIRRWPLTHGAPSPLAGLLSSRSRTPTRRCQAEATCPTRPRAPRRPGCRLPSSSDAVRTPSGRGPERYGRRRP